MGFVEEFDTDEVGKGWVVCVEEMVEVCEEGGEGVGGMVEVMF